MTAEKETEKEHTILDPNTGKEKKEVSDGFVREALCNAIQALNQEVSKPTMTDRNKGDIIDPLQYHVLLAKARENNITAKLEGEMKELTAKFEQKINGLQQDLLVHQRLRLNTNDYR